MPRRSAVRRRCRRRGRRSGRAGSPASRVAAARRDRARERLVVEVVTGAVDERAGLAVAGDRAVDDRRVHRAHRVVADAEAVGDAGPPALAEHVGRGRRARARARGRRRSARSTTTLACATRCRRTGRGTSRIGSPPGGSSLQTSAPRSASICVACGTGRQMPASSTRIPSSRRRCRHATPDHAASACNRVELVVVAAARSRSTASVLARAPRPARGRRPGPSNDDRQARAEEAARRSAARRDAAAARASPGRDLRDRPPLRPARGPGPRASRCRQHRRFDRRPRDVCGSTLRSRRRARARRPRARGRRSGYSSASSGRPISFAQPLALRRRSCTVTDDPAIGAAVRVDRRAARVGVAGAQRRRPVGVVVDGLVEHEAR